MHGQNSKPTQSTAFSADNAKYSHGSYLLWFLWITEHHIVLWFDITLIQLLTTVACSVLAVLFWSAHPSVSLLPVLSHCHEAQSWSDFFTSSENLVCVYNSLTHLQVGLHMFRFSSEALDMFGQNQMGHGCFNG